MADAGFLGREGTPVMEGGGGAGDKPTISLT